MAHKSYKGYRARQRLTLIESVQANVLNCAVILYHSTETELVTMLSDPKCPTGLPRAIRYTLRVRFPKNKLGYIQS